MLTYKFQRSCQGTSATSRNHNQKNCSHGYGMGARAAGTVQKNGADADRSCEGSVSTHLDVQLKKIQTYFGRYTYKTNANMQLVMQHILASSLLKAGSLFCQLPKLLIRYSYTTDCMLI
jgi:hypothetical protein